jgi:hypothetical protein
MLIKVKNGTEMELKHTKKKGYMALLHVFEVRKEIIAVCGCTQSAISRWAKNNYVPYERRAALIEAAKERGWKLTNEQLRGDL